MSGRIEQLCERDRDLVVLGLQALHRERVNAFRSATTACERAGHPAPQRDWFGIHEVGDLLRRVGAIADL